MDYETKKVFLVNIAVLGIGIAATVFAVKFLLRYLLPFVIGAALAIAVKRPARYLAGKTRVKAGGWSVVLVALLYLLCGALAAVLIWQLAVQAGNLAAALPRYLSLTDEFIAQISNGFSGFADSLPPKLSDSVIAAIDNFSDNMINGLTELLSNSTAALIKSLPSVFFSAIITVVASCYIALDAEHLIRFIRELLSPAAYSRLIKIRDIFTENIFKYIMGYVVLSFIAFGELIVGFLILKVKYAVLLAAVTAFVDLLPVFGTGTVLVPWAVISVISGNNGRGVGLLVLYGIICAVRYFAEPHIVGKKVGIDPLISLAAMVIGLKLGGIAGLLLVPVGCIIVIQYYKRQIAEEHENLPGA